jgi:hypothetical protein
MRTITAAAIALAALTSSASAAVDCKVTKDTIEVLRTKADYPDLLALSGLLLLYRQCGVDTRREYQALSARIQREYPPPPPPPAMGLHCETEAIGPFASTDCQPQ